MNFIHHIISLLQLETSSAMIMIPSTFIVLCMSRIPQTCEECRWNAAIIRRLKRGHGAGDRAKSTPFLSLCTGVMKKRQLFFLSLFLYIQQLSLHSGTANLFRSLCARMHLCTCVAWIRPRAATAASEMKYAAGCARVWHLLHMYTGQCARFFWSLLL